MKRFFKLNESQLNKIVKETIKKILFESDYDRYIESESYICRDKNGFEISFTLDWHETEELWTMDAVNNLDGEPIDNDFISLNRSEIKAYEDAIRYIKRHEMI